ncbi:alpha/beta fold hydrolase [Rhodococcus sp. NPDC127528]|uniref:alpha/beta hydrolase family protein n=1 Tax=unclassified Rhodococcus (in: high G+C Gram-positive bacteria) TaxID=192944 RepID=UPI00362EB7CB
MSEPFERDDVRGDLHHPEGEPVGALLLTHGAGGNRDATLLQRAADEFAARGVLVLRYDLPFRQRRPKGPPSPSTAEQDREGIATAVAAVRELFTGPLILGGHSYGGRQSSMLAADRPEVCDGLLLFSYPLHPPGKPEKARTSHLPDLRSPCVFVHGTRDPFGSPDEMRVALELVTAPTRLVLIEGKGHDLAPDRSDAVPRAVDAVGDMLDLHAPAQGGAVAGTAADPAGSEP